MPDKRTSAKPIHIDAADDGERSVVLHPGNEDLFVRTGRQVIADCHLAISLQVWLEELAGMLESVRQWIEERPGRVRVCYCVPKGSRVVLFFSPVSEGFDFKLGRELADLNSHLVQTYNVGMVEVRQVPWGELDRFLTPETARRVYGDQRTAHPAVEA